MVRSRRRLFVMMFFGFIISTILYNTSTSRGIYNVKCNNKSLSHADKPIKGNVLTVPGRGPLLTRLAKLNKMLAEVRRDFLSTAQFIEHSFPLKQPERIQSNSTDFLENFSKIKGMTTIVLPITKPKESILSKYIIKRIYPQTPDICRSIPNDNPNTMLGSYYEWHADKSLCLEMLRPLSRQKYTFWNMCRRPSYKLFKPQPFDQMFPDMRPWDATVPSAHGFQHSVTYISILDEAFITKDGMIISRNYSFIAHFYSQHVLEENIELIGPNTPTYGEVFLITQAFSWRFFYENVEIVPRLAPYMEFLQNHPDVVIHVGPDTKLADTWYKWFNISKNRFVQGRVRARLLYVPESSPLEPSLTLGLQMAACIYEKGVVEDYGWKRRDAVIIIRRTRLKRLMGNFGNIKQILEQLTKKHGLALFEFYDEPVPSFEDTAQIFQRAVLVLSPQLGAGLSNMVFSRPGTYVVEVVCENPNTTLSILPVAYNLGHHYFGISAEGSQCTEHITPPLQHTKNILTLLMPYAVKLKQADHECQ